MNVILLNHTPLEVADIAICKCYGNEPHSDSEKVKARINRVANVSKHASTIEHLNYSFDIDGISRGCLQELARHRIASYTVKSSRYTLQELKECNNIRNLSEASNFIVTIGESLYRGYSGQSRTQKEHIDDASLDALINLQQKLKDGIPNDIAKYCMPEAYKTSLVMTINARALQNFLELRSSKHALWEIQLLAKAMYEVIPDEHKFLYNNIFKEEKK